MEPNVNELPAPLASRSNAAYAQLDEALEVADIVVLLVDHDEFKEVPATKLDAKTVIDTKGIWGRTV